MSQRSRSRRILAGGLALMLAALPVPLQAQDSATILADRVSVTGKNLLTAEGTVEVYYQGKRLTARRVRFDNASGQLTIDGPIRLSEPGKDGTVIVAEQAQLSRDMQDGILTGARLVLARELQLAARKITRSNGRITTFDNVVTSACQVCVSHPTPLWEIRARRITHDAETRRLRFEGARFRAFGLPVAWLPALTLPDPTVERAAGLLRPEFRSNSRLGFGIKLPFFLPIGDQHDLTLTPYVTSKGSKTLGWRSRHALRTGQMQWQGAVTTDRLRPGETRGYVFGEGSFLLPRDYRLGLQVQTVSDREYLSDYNITDADRLWSGVTLDRVRRDKLVTGSFGYFHTLRRNELNSETPSFVGTLTWARRFQPDYLGGEAGLTFDATGFRRASDKDERGRDVVRAGIHADWRRNWLLPQGFLASTELGLTVDHYIISDDSRFADSITRIDPTAAVELRWPLVRHNAGVTHVLEPIARVDLSRNSLEHVPNEDSRLAEFDENNLFAPSRFAGEDLRETGLRLALGGSWTRHDPDGWSLGLTAGRIWRADNPFLAASGSLSAGRKSDWLLAAHYANEDGLRLSNRALVDDSARIRRNETRLAWQNNRIDMSVAYLWLRSDTTEDRVRNLSELTVESRFDLGRGWSAGLSGRYDATAKRAERLGATLTYVNECVSVDLSLSHRRTASTSVKSTTDVGLSVRLAGFGRGASGGFRPGAAPVRRCLR